MKKIRTPLIIAVFSLTPFLISSCAWEKSKIIKQSFQKGKHTVSIVEKDASDPYLSKKKLGHPYNFTETQIFNKLLSLKYKKLALFSRKEDIFDRKLAENVSPLLTKAFKKAGKNDIIEFNVHSPKGRTSGDVFIYKRKLNWRFKTINGVSYERRNSRDYLDSWKLVLLKGQKFHGEKKLFGIRVAKNWLIYPADKTWSNIARSSKRRLKTETKEEFNNSNNELKPTISESLPKNQTNKEISPTQQEIEAQFLRLKSLMQKGLITKEEYKAKRKELLEKYF